METRTSAFDDGPFELLHKIVATYSVETGADRRATVTVHTSGSKSWTGVPTQFVSNHSGEFFIFSFKDKPPSIAIQAQQIIAIEIEDPAALTAMIERPWTSVSGFAVSSKLQAVRDLALLWRDTDPKLIMNFDSLPLIDDAPGFAVLWAKRLKVEIEQIRQEFGDKELSLIKTIEVIYAKGPMTCLKQEDALHFTIDISAESLDRKSIKSKISDAL